MLAKLRKEYNVKSASDIKTGQCIPSQNSICWHQLKIRYGTSALCEWQDLGMRDGRAILAFYLVNDLPRPNDHFDVYHRNLIPDQKQKSRYRRGTKPESSEPMDTSKDSKEPSSPSPADVPLRKKPKISSAAADDDKTENKSKALTEMRAGDVGGVRGIGSQNKGKRKEFVAPVDANGKPVGYGTKVQNCVLKCRLHGGVPLDLIKEAMFGRFDRTFPLVTVEIDDPHSAVSYAKSGEASVAGCKSRFQAILAAHLFNYWLVKLFQVPYELTNAGPVNFACSLRFGLEAVGKRIDLHRFRRDHSEHSVVVYDPDKFKGLRWKLRRAKVVVIIYPYGAINIVGPRTEKDVEFIKKDVVTTLQMLIPRYCVDDKPDVLQPPALERESGNEVMQLVPESPAATAITTTTATAATIATSHLSSAVKRKASALAGHMHGITTAELIEEVD